jgi:hypothetical protein
MSSAPSRYGHLPDAARQALAEVLSLPDPSIVGLVLTGSAARGLATAHSDVDVVIVRNSGPASQPASLSPAIDEIPMTLAELESVKPVGSAGAWDRWSFAWAHVLRDTSGGRVTSAVRRQATLTEQEVRDLLVGRARLDEFVNFTYRALKSHGDGRGQAARLDAAESVAAMLDVVFALAGRVRPYNKYLAWELQEHPLPSEEWRGEVAIRRAEGLLDGKEDAIRECFLAVERECRAYDRRTGHGALAEVLDAWGTGLLLIRGTAAE